MYVGHVSTHTCFAMKIDLDLLSVNPTSFYVWRIQRRIKWCQSRSFLIRKSHNFTIVNKSPHVRGEPLQRGRIAKEGWRKLKKATKGCRRLQKATEGYSRLEFDSIVKQVNDIWII